MENFKRKKIILVSKKKTPNDMRVVVLEAEFSTEKIKIENRDNLESSDYIHTNETGWIDIDMFLELADQIKKGLKNDKWLD